MALVLLAGIGCLPITRKPVKRPIEGYIWLSAIYSKYSTHFKILPFRLRNAVKGSACNLFMWRHQTHCRPEIGFQNEGNIQGTNQGSWCFALKVFLKLNEDSVAMLRFFEGLLYLWNKTVYHVRINLQFFYDNFMDDLKSGLWRESNNWFVSADRIHKTQVPF